VSKGRWIRRGAWSITPSERDETDIHMARIEQAEKEVAETRRAPTLAWRETDCYQGVPKTRAGTELHVQLAQGRIEVDWSLT
jgi:hypothetical protein